VLKPSYFDDPKIYNRIVRLWQRLEDFILKDISRRLLAQNSMTPTADRLIARLRVMGESKEEIQKKLSEIMKVSREELKKVLQDAVLTSWEDEREIYESHDIDLKPPLENDNVIRIIDAEYKKSLGELENLSKSTMNQAYSDLGRMIDEAEMRVASGIQNYNSAICDVLDEYAGRGIYVDYPTGARRTLEAAVRCAVVTSANQTAAQMQLEYMREAKTNLLLVSGHLGARTAQKGQPPYADHSAWQARVYHIKDEDLKKLTSTTVADTG
jgi:hypothetical protein